MIFKLAGAAALVFCSSAYAGDRTDRPGLLSWGDNISGYFDVHGGLDFGFDDYFFDGAPIGDFTWLSSDFGGAARVSLEIDPRFSIQADAWANNFGTSSRNTYLGAGLHATFDPTGNDQMGPFASIGGEYMVDYDQHFLTRLDMTNFGLEWAHNADKWRLYGQVGYSSNINGMAFIEGWEQHWQEIPFENIYGAVVGTFFFTPDLALSAKFAIDKYETSGVNWVVNNFELHWGAKFEYQPKSLPIIGYVAYSGRYEAFDNAEQNTFAGRGIETVVIAGIKVPFGRSTIQDLYKHVGLADLNPAFGDFTY